MLQWIKRRLRCSITTNTYSSRNVAVTTMRKSHAMSPWACTRRNVDQRISPLGRRFGLCGILIHRSRRDLNSQLQQEFIGDALLAPRGFLARHPADQDLNLKRNRRSAGSRLQPPEQFPSRSVPTKHRLGAHYDQNVPPVEEL